MKIAIITPYYKEPIEFLEKCHESVLKGSVPADHFLIADGFPNPTLSSWTCRHVVLPTSHGDNGNTPRGIGGMLAVAEGYDALAYLDADNWFHIDHLESLINLQLQTGADVCTSFRTIHSLDGSLLVGAQDSDEVNLIHVDTSCYLIGKSAFALNNIWLNMPKVLSPICDRIFLKGVVENRFRIASTKKKSVAFRSQYKAHYLAANVSPPVGLKDNVGKECFEYLSTLDGIRDSVKSLGFVPF